MPAMRRRGLQHTRPHTRRGTCSSLRKTKGRLSTPGWDNQTRQDGDIAVTTLLIPAGRGAWVRTVGCPDPWQLHADTPIEINANPNATEPGQIVSARLMTLCEQAAETD